VAISPKTVESPDVIREWKSRTDNPSFHWTGKELFVQFEGEKQMPIFSQIAGDFCRTLQAGKDADCFCGHSFRISSIVGGIVSFDHESSFSCQGSYTNWRYSSLDVSRRLPFRYPRLVEYETEGGAKPHTSSFMDLRELFSESDIFNALMKNAQVSAAVGRSSARKHLQGHSSLAQLSKILTDPQVGLSGSFYLERDFLSRFAFHHLEGDTVAVWISLTPDSHVGQGNENHLEIILTIPEKLFSAMQRADSRQEGFLLKDAPEFVGTSYAEFEFEAGKETRGD